MRYRPLGKTGLRISALSFGCMRLSNDEELNKRIIGKAIDMGVNYFETTRGYLRGTCQHRVAPGIKRRTTGIIVSGKEGINPNKSAYLFRKEIERQLEILGLTHFKFMQVGWYSWAMMPHLLKPGGVLDALRQAREEGLVQHIGFTGHDQPEDFIKCIETGLFDSITVPYNLINRRYEPTIKRAGELGIGVVAMCPVAGGILSSGADTIKTALNMDLPTPEMALRFVLSNPDVSTACSGMNTMEQLDQNVRTAWEFDPEKNGRFEEMCEGLERLTETFGSNVCTACGYCQPCPKDVNIPHYMGIYRNWKAFGLETQSRNAMQKTDPENSLDNCDECGACEEKCPNDLNIRDTLKELKTLLT